MQNLDRITFDPKVMGGKPCIRGMRVTVGTIVGLLASGHSFEYSQHASDQSLLRQISVTELRQAIRMAQMIEDYPTDKYGPSCLLLGFSDIGRPLHIQCSYPTRPILKVITIYEPDAALWTDFRVRK
ncbi:MAG: DUF433 domain-containing protein [Caldilineaceae bacterium]|nr:DUF433 domain-containing protein [Caldilineaceae bacterium]HRJ40311.1 DUF433 domain-containing protein [Caldilineaceae bacterium]